MNHKTDMQADFEHWVTTVWRPDDGAELLKRDYPRMALAAWKAALASCPDAQEDERGAIYVECRECAECGHIGINDSHPTDAACDYSCDWTGPSPIEDKCPGCGNENVMTAACPKCSGRYKFMAEATIQTSVAAPQVEAAPEPKQIKAPDIILTGAQLLEALDFIAPDRDSDQLESEAAFAYGEGHSGKAMYVWCADYPEEGSFVCDGSSAAASPKAEAAQGVTEGIAEGLEILDNFIASVRKNGNYSPETTLNFIGQARQCFAAPSPDREQATLCEDGGKCGIGGYCGQCEKVRAASDPEQPSERGERPIEPEDIDAVAEAIQRETSVEWLIASRAAVAAIDTLIARGNHASEHGEQDCPHGVDDGACKQCYGEAVRGEQEAAKGVCQRCGGTGVVADGEITGAGGVEFENGPVKCVKDCPDCALISAKEFVKRWGPAVDEARKVIAESEKEGVKT